LSHCSSEAAELARLIFTLPCHVKIPEKLRANFERRGMVPSDEVESQQFPRMYCHGDERRAALELRQTFPALPRKSQWFGVQLADISRGGCRFLHVDPLYPGEQSRLVISSGTRTVIEILWCRRLGEQCFEVGAKFAQPLDPSTRLAQLFGTP